jgi:hypothetical protein
MIKRFDPENTGYVSSSNFLKRLGLLKETSANGEISGHSDENNHLLENSLSESFNSSSINEENFAVPHIPKAKVSVQKNENNYTVKSSRRNTKNPVEKWLKKKFRDGFSKMKNSFEEMDLQKTGQVHLFRLSLLNYNYNLI